MNASLWQLAGWTMIHSLWLGAAVALAGGFLRLASRRAAPHTRYAISLATLTLLTATPLATAAWLSVNGVPQLAMNASILPPPPGGEGWGGGQPGYTASHPSLTFPLKGRESEEQVAGQIIDLAHPSPSPRYSGERLGEGLNPLTTSPQPNATAENPILPPSAIPLPATYSPTHLLTYSLPHLPTLWLIGAPLTFTLLATGLLGSARLRRRATLITAGPAFDACERLRHTLNITRRVALAACDGVAQPILVGIVRPLILLPTAALAGWTPEQLDMVLLHELAHVRRWDNLVNLLQRIVESLLFFHPAVWLLSRQVRRDREECCDDAVIRHTDRPHQYAELLVSIAAALRGGPAPSLAVASAMASHPLAGRIRRILNIEAEPMRITRRTLAATLLLPLLLAGAIFYSGASAEDAQNSPPSKEQPSTVASGERAQGGSPEETPATPDAAPSASPSDASRAVPENSEDSYTVNYPIKPDTQIDLFDLVRSLGGHNLKVDMVANEWVIMLHAPKQAHNRLRVLLGDTTLPQPAKHVAQPAQLSWNNTSAAAAAPPLLGSNAAAGQQEIIVHFPPSFPNSDLERERIRKALAADGHHATLTSLKSMLESATGEIEEKSVPCLRVNVPNDWRAKPVWETSDGGMTCRIVNDPSTARLSPPYSGSRYSAGAGSPDSPNQGGAPTRSNANNAGPTSNTSPDSAVPAQNTTTSPYSHPEVEFTQLQNEIRKLEDLIAKAQKDLVDLEVFKELSVQNANNPEVMKAAIDKELEKDPTLNMNEQQLFELNSQLQARLSASKNPNDDDIKRLRASMQEAEAELAKHRSEAESALREKIAKMPNEALRSAITEYKIRRKSVEENLAKYEQDLAAANAKLRQLSQSPAELNAKRAALKIEHANITASLKHKLKQLKNLADWKEPYDPSAPQQTLEQLKASNPEARKLADDIEQDAKRLAKLEEQLLQIRIETAPSSTTDNNPSQADLRTVLAETKSRLQRQLADLNGGVAEAEGVEAESAAASALKEKVLEWQVMNDARGLLRNQDAATTEIDANEPQPTANASPAVSNARAAASNGAARFHHASYATNGGKPEGFSGLVANAKNQFNGSITWDEAFSTLHVYGPDVLHARIQQYLQRLSSHIVHNAPVSPFGPSEASRNPKVSYQLRKGSRSILEQWLAEHPDSGVAYHLTDPNNAPTLVARGAQEAHQQLKTALLNLGILIAINGEPPEPLVSKSYPMDDILLVNASQFSQALGGTAEILWDTANRKLAVMAPERIHAQVATLLQKNGESSASAWNSKRPGSKIYATLPADSNPETIQRSMQLFERDGSDVIGIPNLDGSISIVEAISEDAATRKRLIGRMSPPTGPHTGWLAPQTTPPDHLHPGDQVASASAASSTRPVENENQSSPFPTLENQKIADRAYKLLGLELEPLSAEDLDRVKKLGYSGGLKVAQVIGDTHGAQGYLQVGHLLVGLHVWPVTDLASLDEILRRPDLGDLTPLKYYAVREFEGGFNSGKTGDELTTGRLSIPEATLLSRDLATTGRMQAEMAAIQVPSDVQPISVMQPPTSQKTSIFGGTVTTAYLKVKFGRLPGAFSGPPGAFSDADVRLTPQEIAIQAQNCIDIVKSPSVLKAALAVLTPPETVDMKPTNAVEWLRNRLSATFPGEGEILELKLEGGDAKEDIAILKAVIDAFLAAMKAPPESPADPNAAAVPPGNLNPDLGRNLNLASAAAKYPEAFAKALEQSRKVGKPVILHFLAHDSEPSQRFVDEVLANEQVMKFIDEHFVPVTIYANDEPAFAKKFQVSLIPANVFVFNGGARTGGLAVQATPAAYIAQLQQMYNIATNPAPSPIHGEPMPVTPPVPVADRPGGENAATASDKPTFLYDGKTFDQWRDLWKLELNPERRIEAIKALTAFNRAGRGREAADAVFEVASQYDFAKNYSSEEEELKQTVVRLCTETYGNQIATTDWLPALEQVLKKDPKQNKAIALWLLQQMQDTSDEARAALQVLAANEDPEVCAAAKEAWAWPDKLSEKLMEADADGDQQLSKQEVADAKTISVSYFQSIDKNGDDQLSITELRKAMPKYLDRHGRNGPGGNDLGGGGGGFF